jgi:hypothetical protein
MPCQISGMWFDAARLSTLRSRDGTGGRADDEPTIDQLAEFPGQKVHGKALFCRDLSRAPEWTIDTPIPDGSTICIPAERAASDLRLLLGACPASIGDEQHGADMLSPAAGDERIAHLLAISDAARANSGPDIAGVRSSPPRPSAAAAPDIYSPEPQGEMPLAQLRIERSVRSRSDGLREPHTVRRAVLAVASGRRADAPNLDAAAWRAMSRVRQRQARRPCCRLLWGRLAPTLLSSTVRPTASVLMSEPAVERDERVLEPLVPGCSDAAGDVLHAALYASRDQTQSHLFESFLQGTRPWAGAPDAEHLRRVSPPVAETSSAARMNGSDAVYERVTLLRSVDAFACTKVYGRARDAAADGRKAPSSRQDDELLEFDLEDAAGLGVDRLGVDCSHGLDAFMSVQAAGPKTGAPAPPQAQQGPTQKPRPRAVVAPAALVLSRPSLDLARACLDLGRSFVLLPPPLSALPSIVTLANTYLHDANMDHRVLVLCVGFSLDAVKHVFEYVRLVLGGRHRLCLPDAAEAGDVSAEQSAARVIVAGSVGLLQHERLRAARFSLVAILVQSSAVPQPGSSLDDLKSISQEQHLGICQLPSTVVAAPYPCCLDVPAAASALEVVKRVFQVGLVVLRNPLTEIDVRTSVALARPSHVYIVLPPAAQEAVQALEEAAFPVLRAHVDKGSAVPPTLASLDMAAIHRALQRARSGEGEHALDGGKPMSLQDLILINALKRALTFCVNDNVRKAQDFVRLASAKFPHAALRACLLRLTAAIGEPEGETGASAYHRADCIRSLLERERREVDEGGSDTRTIRVQQAWRPLVVADSSRVADWLLDTLERAVDIAHLNSSAEPAMDQGGRVFVAHAGQLQTTTENHVQAVRYLSQFSHVLHVSDVVSGEWSGATVVPVEQLSDAGRLRLVRVVVDTGRRMEDATEAANSLFSAACLAMGEPATSTAGRAALACHDAERFISVARQLPSTSERRAPAGVASGDAELHLSLGILARHTADWIAGILFTRLRDAAARRGPGSKLTLTVHVPPGMSTHAACLTLHEAIAADRRLLESVSVSYKMEAPLAIPAVPFHPKKRLKRGRGGHPQGTQSFLAASQETVLERR